MNKGEYIQKEVGKILEPLGYDFKRYTGLVIWEYHKNTVNDAGDNITLSVIFKRFRFAPILEMELRTTAYGQKNKKVPSFVPDWNKIGLVCENDLEFKSAIDEYANILKKYGLKELDLMKQPATDERFLKDDHRYVYECHDQILTEFLQNNSLNENIGEKEVIKLIFDRLKNLRGKNFFVIKDELLELSVLHASLYEKRYDHYWEWRDEVGICILTIYKEVRGEKQYHYHKPLFIINRCWKENDEKRCMKKLSILLQGNPF